MWPLSTSPISISFSRIRCGRSTKCHQLFSIFLLNVDSFQTSAWENFAVLKSNYTSSNSKRISCAIKQSLFEAVKIIFQLIHRVAHRYRNRVSPPYQGIFSTIIIVIVRLSFCCITYGPPLSRTFLMTILFYFLYDKFLTHMP